MRIDEFLPRYDTAERHQITVHAPPDRAYAAVKSIDLLRIPVVAGLLALRGIPRIFSGDLPLSRRLGFDQLVEAGFVVLDEIPGEEIVLGLVGQFWRPTAAFRRIAAEEFVPFDEAGYAKAAQNFAVESHGSTSTLITETRVQFTDDDARRQFSRYWRFVGPFSGLIRTQILRRVQREAER